MNRIALLLFLVGACAYAKVVKVPHPSSYGYKPNTDEWRAILKEADKIEGVRFYMPRPYVIVKKEYPIGGETFFLNGTLDKDGRVTIQDEIPARHAQAFPDRRVAAAIHDPKGLASGEGDLRRQSESAGASTTAPTAASGGPETLGVSNDSYLTVDSITPRQVDAADRVVAFQITLAKDPVGEGIGGTLDEAVYVVPVVQGKHAIAKAVKADFLSNTVGASDKHVFQAQLAAKQLPEFYSLGVIVKKTADGKTTNLLFHRTTIDGTNPYASEGRPGDEPQKKEPTGDEPKKPLSSATISTMGNLTTSPYQKVGELFDIALYPDFTEQYAMRAAGGIGYAKADLAFENGWLVERVSMEMDNRELGQLIADTARKIVDAAIAAVSPVGAAADVIAQQPMASQFRLQAEGARGATVVLRVDFVEYATPGMHPLLKPEECAGDDRAPRVAYQQRSRYEISLVNLAGPKGATPSATGLSEEDMKKVAGAVASVAWNTVAGHDKVFAKDPQFQTKVSATSAAACVFPITYLKAAELPGLTDDVRNEYFTALTGAIRAKSTVIALKSVEATPR